MPTLLMILLSVRMQLPFASKALQTPLSSLRTPVLAQWLKSIGIGVFELEELLQNLFERRDVP